jgi:hypothetical protein
MFRKFYKFPVGNIRHLRPSSLSNRMLTRIVYRSVLHTVYTTASVTTYAWKGRVGGRYFSNRYNERQRREGGHVQYCGGGGRSRIRASSNSNSVERPVCIVQLFRVPTLSPRNGACTQPNRTLQCLNNTDTYRGYLVSCNAKKPCLNGSHRTDAQM